MAIQPLHSVATAGPDLAGEYSEHWAARCSRTCLEIMHGALCEPCDAGKIYGSAFNISEPDTGPQRVCSVTMYLHVLQPQDAGARQPGFLTRGTPVYSLALFRLLCV